MIRQDKIDVTWCFFMFMAAAGVAAMVGIGAGC